MCFLILVLLGSFFLLYLIDIRLNYVLKNFVDNEVERFTRNIVSKRLNELFLDEKYKELFDISYKNVTEEGLSLNTFKINKLLGIVSNSVYSDLKSIEDGEIDSFFIPKRISTGKYKKVKNGIVFDCSISSLRGSSLFANLGPSVPLKLLFVGQVNSNVDVKTKEYGINNLMIEVYIVVEVKEEVVMPLSSRQKKIIIKKPILMDIVKGGIPNYYSYPVK